MLDAELRIAKELARRAGATILTTYKDKPSFTYKKDLSPVTTADLEANNIIVAGLHKAFPEDGLLTEESGGENLDAERVWIVDPLDGTKEFISGSDEFTVNIALVENRKPMLGVICLPAKAELYWGFADGAFKEGCKEPLHVSGRSRIGGMTLVMSLRHATAADKEFAKLFRKTVSKGSSLKGLMLATGEADVYVRSGPVNEWDICAMEAIIRASGGTMTLLDGQEIQYGEGRLVEGFLTSNGKNHEELLALLRGS